MRMMGLKVGFLNSCNNTIMDPSNLAATIVTLLAEDSQQILKDD